MTSEIANMFSLKNFSKYTNLKEFILVTYTVYSKSESPQIGFKSAMNLLLLNTEDFILYYKQADITQCG